ncbi:MAG: translation initiation factor IF-2 [Clostridiales bacterium]|nr:translation initiation factor IF-2 [Clostridiales bacterium]
MLVKDLAAELNKTNNEVLEKATELGISAKGATKNLSGPEIAMIRKGFDDLSDQDRKGPRRIRKADVEAEKKAAQEAAIAEAEQKAAEEAAAKLALTTKKAPVLSVAKKFVDESAGAVKTEKPAGTAKTERPAGTAKTEKPAAVVKTGKPAGTAEAEKPAAVTKTEKPAETVKTEKPAAVTKTEKPAETVKTKKSEKPSKAARPESSAEHRAEAAPEKKGESGKPKGERDGKTAKPQGGGAAKPQGGGAAKPQGDGESKSRDKKKGRDAQAGRKPARGGRMGAADNLRGAVKTPILESGTLEKQQRRRVRRHIRTQDGTDSVVFEDLAPGTVLVTVPITVAGLASQIERSPSELILALVKLGVMANINQNLDELTVGLLAEELDVPIVIGKDEADELVEENFSEPDDLPEIESDLQPRPPIITVMGHVDHGKTSLLDAIRSTNVTAREAGGITQHIGASEVICPNGERVVFLDTPGHEAFTAMRARGAHVTDIAVLVVAADDGVMPQTIESISHARAAGVPIIVAINKIDKEGANPDRVKQELSDHGVLVEDWGGDVICVPVSAKKGIGIDSLLEMILLQAEVLELRANPKKKAVGTVIEARLDKSKGPLATLLVLDGTLTDKMSIVAGTTSAKVRTMTDFKSKGIKKAGPATAVEITGFLEVPQAGDSFRALRDDHLARDIAERRKIRQREEVMAKTSGTSLENLYSKIKEGKVKELDIILKVDVMGSIGAIASSLEKIDVAGVKINMIHRAAGTVTESDVMLASTSGAIIIGFNVRPPANVTALAEREGVEIRLYRVIYDVINEIEAALKGMLDPEFREVVLGKAQVRETFRLPNGSTIAGSYVLDGKILRNAEIRLVRDGVVIHEGRISSLHRFKDDVREVAQGYECGIGIENYNDIKINDEIEVFRMEEIERE